FETLMIMTGDATQQSFVIAHHPLAPPAPGQDSALFEGFFWIGNYQGLVENHFLSEAMANRASASRGVEGEMFGRERFVAFTGGGAEIAVGVKGLEPELRVES